MPTIVWWICNWHIINWVQASDNFSPYTPGFNVSSDLTALWLTTPLLLCPTDAPVWGKFTEFGKCNDRTFNIHLSYYTGKYICLVLTTLSSKKPWSSVRCCPSNRSVSRSVSGSSVRNNMFQKVSTESIQNCGHLNLQLFLPSSWQHSVAFTCLMLWKLVTY